ncbi:MAG TPA: sulfite exporter TauE/SafE family protein [Planctomycetota bacterium]|nr:sulfite exporter TauE/SafE family protein [Planctomycetota bacterium]
MDPLQAFILAAAGLLAGFLNTLAGGGSAVTVPALEWVTGSPGLANATNRIAILFQNLAGVAGFSTGRAVPFRLAIRLAVPMTLGGVAGAYVATLLPDSAMRVALSLSMGLVAVSAFVRPPKTPPLRSPWTEVTFLLVGFYTGLVQVGVGFILLACLVGGLSLDLVRANATKVFVVLVATVPTLVVFLLDGKLLFAEGLVLGCGNMGGAWIAARLAVKRGGSWIRWVIAASALGAITKLLVFPG